MAVNDIDELNILRLINGDTYQRYKKFFSEMDISDDRVENRIVLATAFDTRMLTLLSLALVLWESGQYDRAIMRVRFRAAYLGAVEEAGRLDEFAEERAIVFADEVEKTTYDGLREETLVGTIPGGGITPKTIGGDSTPVTSIERVEKISETETAIIENRHEMVGAIEAGKTRKTWVTKRDKRVRKTHKEVDGKTLPIDQPFILSGTEMQYPGDTTNDPPAEEIVGCRCALHFS